MKGFVSFNENTFVEGLPCPDNGVGHALYGIWCPPNCGNVCTSPFSVGITITPDYGIWPPLITPDYGIWPPPVVCK